MCGKEMRSEWELWWWEAGRRKGHRGMERNGTVLCSLEFHKGLPAPQSVSRESPRVVAGMVCWSFPVSPVTMVLGRLHHSVSVERKGFFLFLSKTPSPLKKKYVRWHAKMVHIQPLTQGQSWSCLFSIIRRGFLYVSPWDTSFCVDPRTLKTYARRATPALGGNM